MNDDHWAEKLASNQPNVNQCVNWHMLQTPIYCTQSLIPIQWSMSTAALCVETGLPINIFRGAESIWSAIMTGKFGKKSKADRSGSKIIKCSVLKPQDVCKKQKSGFWPLKQCFSGVKDQSPTTYVLLALLLPHTRFSLLGVLSEASKKPTDFSKLKA